MAIVALLGFKFAFEREQTARRQLGILRFLRIPLRTLTFSDILILSSLYLERKHLGPLFHRIGLSALLGVRSLCSPSGRAIRSLAIPKKVLNSLFLNLRHLRLSGTIVGSALALFQTRSSFKAVFTKATCENACGKLPTSRFALKSYSSDNNPTSFRNFISFSNSSLASSVLPNKR